MLLVAVALSAGLRRVPLDELTFTDAAWYQEASGQYKFTTIPPATIKSASVQAVIDANGAATASSSAAPSSASQALPEAPRGSLRATLKRIGAPVPSSTDTADLTQALRAALSKVRMPLLRGLLFERGGSCAGCTERAEFVRAVELSTQLPLVGRHALPLFLYESPLLPHTQMKLHLFEPRYKLLCRKALKAERLFGFVSGSVGTLARIQQWRFTHGDATDGSCHVTVAGLRRFRLGRKWEETCVGCSTGPLHFADVTYFNDTSASEASIAKGVALVKESLRLHHTLVDAGAARDVEEQVGEAPTQRDRGHAMSFWLAAACAVLDERCRAQAPAVLTSTSTVERVEQVLQVQKTLAGQRFTSKRRK